MGDKSTKSQKLYMVLSGYVDLHVNCIIPPYISSQNGYLNFYRIRFSNYLPHSISDMQMNVPWGACMRVFQNCCLNFEETTRNTINNERRTVQVNCFYWPLTYQFYAFIFMKALCHVPAWVFHTFSSCDFVYYYFHYNIS